MGRASHIFMSNVHAERCTTMPTKNMTIHNALVLRKPIFKSYFDVPKVYFLFGLPGTHFRTLFYTIYMTFGCIDRQLMPL